MSDFRNGSLYQTHKLHIKNIIQSHSSKNLENRLFWYFSEFGEVTDFRILQNRDLISSRRVLCLRFISRRRNTPSSSKQSKLLRKHKSLFKSLVIRAKVTKQKKKDFFWKENSDKLFVGGIPVKVTQKEFFDYFSSFGGLKKVVLPKDQYNVNNNCGYGFIDYFNQEVTKMVFEFPGKHCLRAKEVKS